MGTDKNNSPQPHQGDSSQELKAFVERVAGDTHPERKQEKATGTNKLNSEQNKLIDQHNLRK